MRWTRIRAFVRVLSFTAVSTRGVHSVLKARSLQRVVTLVGCEQDSDLIGYLGDGEIAALVAENTYRMGFEAVGLISGLMGGKANTGPVHSASPVDYETKSQLARNRYFHELPEMTDL